MCLDNTESWLVGGPILEVYITSYTAVLIGPVNNQRHLRGNWLDYLEHEESLAVLRLCTCFYLYSSDMTSNNQRHLRGNWLAYWEHEVGLSAVEDQLTPKQIRLMSFGGAGKNVYCICTVKPTHTTTLIR